jgi:hypothetical protein
MVILMRRLVLILLTILACVQARPASAESGIDGCRSIELDAERLACYDAIPTASQLDDARSDPESVAAEQAVNGSHLPAAVPPKATTGELPSSLANAETMAEAAFGKTTSQLNRERLERLDQTELKELDATVLEIQTMGNRKLKLILDNGQIWHQISSSYLRLTEGDSIVIKKGALGSYRLTKVGNNRAMQVRRAD